MAESIGGVERIIAYTFNDPTILWEALQAAGSGVSVVGTRQITSEGNKRMAIVGDSWMRTVIVCDWYRSGKPKGTVDRVIQALLSNTNLDRVGRLHGLDRYVHGNPSQLGVVSPRTMADTMEAIMAAVVEDGQEVALRAVMGRLGLLVTDEVETSRVVLHW